MASTLGVVPRTALAAPTDPTIIRVQSAVVLVTSVLSVLGAAWIIASFVAFSNLRTFRHQLIFGLAFSDCIMALNFLVSSSMDVAGRWIGAPEQARYCTFNGFITQVFVIQTDYWVLIVAVCTYFVLADHKRCSSWVQAKVPILCALPWLLSITWACIGLGVTGYGDIGAWCWFTSDQVRLLVNFVPRCNAPLVSISLTPTVLDSVLTSLRDHHRHHVGHVRQAVPRALPRPPPYGLARRIRQPQRLRLPPTRRHGWQLRPRHTCKLIIAAHPPAKEARPPNAPLPPRLRHRLVPAHRHPHLPDHQRRARPLAGADPRQGVRGGARARRRGHLRRDRVFAVELAESVLAAQVPRGAGAGCGGGAG